MTLRTSAKENSGRGNDAANPGASHAVAPSSRRQPAMTHVGRDIMNASLDFGAIPFLPFEVGEITS